MRRTGVVSFLPGLAGMVGGVKARGQSVECRLRLPSHNNSAALQAGPTYSYVVGLSKSR